MFTGIIEVLGTIQSVKKEGTNVHFTIKSKISNQLKVDQSVSHDGVCLTVVKLKNGTHTVTAIEETIKRTNLASWKKGRIVNLERATQSSSRLDGHIVQGHVDTTGRVKSIRECNGSWYFTFEFKKQEIPLLVDKGSITVNGVSLTVIKPKKKSFSVAIIPYTYENTCFKQLKRGDTINLEFDIIAKHLAKMLKPYLKRLGK